MWTKSLRDCEAKIANDGCRIYELVHPANDKLSLPYSLTVAEVAPRQASYQHRPQQSEVY